MASDKVKLIAGAVILVISTIALMAAGFYLELPLVLAAIATTGLAVGSLLVGTTGEGRSV